MPNNAGTVFEGTSFDVDEYQEEQRRRQGAGEEPLSPFEYALGRQWPEDPDEQDELWANVPEEAKQVYESTGAEWPDTAPSVTAKKQEEAEKAGAPPAKGGGGGGSSSAALDRLRDVLASFFIKNLMRPTEPFPGGVEVPETAALAQAISLIESTRQARQPDIERAAGIGRELGGFQTPGFALSTTEELARTGGTPDITRALAAIRSQGLGDIERFQSEERERFGALGLSAGSDISEALGRGTSQGISDILARQETLIADILQRGAQTRLQAAQVAGGLTGQAAQIRGAGAGILSGLAGLERQSGLEAGTAIANIGLQQQGVAERNKERAIQEFIRRQLPPALLPATSLAGVFPPQAPVIPSGGGGGWASLIPLIAAIGLAPTTGGGSLFGSIFASSRSVKDEPEEVAAREIAERLAKLPLYRWNYRGDSTKHIGPMAEDFHAAFGVGDDRTLNPIDLLGVMLAVNKAVAEKFVRSGGTEGATPAVQ